MYLADVNIWLALAFDGHAHHQTVRTWFRRKPRQRDLTFCRATQQSFLRLVTTASVAKGFDAVVLSNAEAWALYDRLRGGEQITWTPEPEGLEAIWKRLSVRGQSSPKLWADAYLSAFAIAAEAEIVTLDRAFRQFDGLSATVLDPA